MTKRIIQIGLAILLAYLTSGCVTDGIIDRNIGSRSKTLTDITHASMASNGNITVTFRKPQQRSWRYTLKANEEALVPTLIHGIHIDAYQTIKPRHVTSPVLLDTSIPIFPKLNFPEVVLDTTPIAIVFCKNSKHFYVYKLQKDSTKSEIFRCNIMQARYRTWWSYPARIVATSLAVVVDIICAPIYIGVFLYYSILLYDYDFP